MVTNELFNLDDLLKRVCLKLQLSPNQHRVAEDRYKTIGAWLEAPDSLLKPFQPSIYPQGSLRIGTTVQPRGHQEYDLDLVCELRLLDWRSLDPISLLGALENRLRGNQTYRDMIERMNRCIRINYANEFHLDILPACPDPAAGHRCVVVPDRDAKAWRPSNPGGFADWFDSRAKLFVGRLTERVQPLPPWEPHESKLPLQLVVQLFKRWRDIRYGRYPELAPISIVLTTLAGSFYEGEQSPSHALGYVLDRILSSAASSAGRLYVRNPMNPAEDLSERWSNQPKAYKAFVSGIADLRQRWTQVLAGGGIHRAAEILEGLFGEDITQRALKEHIQAVEEARSNRTLGFGSPSGFVSAGLGSSIVPVKPNTFYGA